MSAPAPPIEPKTTLRVVPIVSSSRRRKRAHGGADPLQGAAAANVGDGLCQVRVSGMRIAHQKRCDRHDHSRLAIAALWDLMIDPGLLHLGDATGADAFYGRYFRSL